MKTLCLSPNRQLPYIFLVHTSFTILRLPVSQDTYLIDVREPNEVVQGMIPSAVNLPLTVLADSLHSAPEAFLARHGYEKPKTGQRIIFYCRSGMRSTSASDVAKRNGYTK